LVLIYHYFYLYFFNIHKNYKEIYRKKAPQKVRAHSSVWIEWLPAEQLVEGSNPSGPALNLTKCGFNISKIMSADYIESLSNIDNHPLDLFLSMLDAPDSKRQYPKRL
jgi:hypothetical protein